MSRASKPSYLGEVTVTFHSDRMANLFGDRLIEADLLKSIRTEKGKTVLTMLHDRGRKLETVIKRVKREAQDLGLVNSRYY